MKPTTLYTYIFLSFCLVAVIMSWSAVFVINGQADRLRDVVVEQQAEIQNLKIHLAIAKNRTDIGLVLEYIMPEIYISELSQIAHEVRKMKGE